MAATVSRTEYGFMGSLKVVVINGHWTGTDTTASIPVPGFSQILAVLPAPNGTDDVIVNTDTPSGDDTVVVPSTGVIAISRTTNTSAAKFALVVIGFG